MRRTRRTGLRGALDALYRASGALAALLLAAIAAIVLAQIVSRLVGVKITGADDFAAWSMAGTVFLALPRTLAQGGHIRVSLVLEALPARAARTLEIAAAGVGAAVAGWAAWSVLDFVWSSYRLGDVSQGEIVVPLWIPQLSMAAGFALLAVACLEMLVMTLRGGRADDGTARLDGRPATE